MSEQYQPVVAKFGGTSMARLDVVARRLEQARPTRPIDVVVVSAAGRDEQHGAKMTDLLIDYAADPAVRQRERITQRLRDVAARAALVKPVAEIEAELASALEAPRPEHAVPALGEQWSAQLLADATGRRYIDARDVVAFDDQGQLDELATTTRLRSHVAPGEQVVIPGFYGARPDGSVQLFERGGSDISGALAARALGASEYQNWSDVPGFFTTNPRQYHAARPVPELTYHEARELAQGGSELLHREVGRYLHDAAIPTVMYDTFSGETSSRVVPSRRAGETVVGVSGTPSLWQLIHAEFGSEERAGTMTELFVKLRQAGMPFSHSATSTDVLALYFGHMFGSQLKKMFSDDDIHDTGMIHLVGEGLRDPLARMRLIGTVATAFASVGIGSRGMTDVEGTPAMTLFIDPDQYDAALHCVHERVLG